LKEFKVEGHEPEEGLIQSVFRVRDKKPPIEYSKAFRFSLVFDTGSEVSRLNYWGDRDIEAINRLYDSIQQGSVVYVKGAVKTFQDRMEVNVNKGEGVLRLATENETTSHEFIWHTNQDTDMLWDQLIATKNKFTNPYLRALLDSFMSDPEFKEQYKTAPAAMYIHHAVTGGLIEHTAEVVKICTLLTEIHPSLDKDLLLTAAILHDIGKIQEYTVNTGIDQTRKGMLIGHTYIGAQMINNRITELDQFPENLHDKLTHMILSHQGKAEYGAGQTPKTPEAATLHHADNLSAQVTQYIRAKKDAKTTGFKSRWNRRTGAVYLE